MVILLIQASESSSLRLSPFCCHLSGIENSSHFHRSYDKNITNIIKFNITMHEV